MNYYFEMHNVAGTPRFCSYLGEVDKDIAAPMQAVHMANKVWVEHDDGKVVVIKDRRYNEKIFDEQEFFWAKLNSQPINR